MVTRIFDDATEARIAARRREGLRLVDLVAEFGGSTQSIAGALRRQGASEPRPGKTVTAQQRAQIAAEYSAGDNYHVLARRYQVRTDVIGRALMETDTPIRPSGKHKRFDAAEAARLLAEYEAGASMQQLAERHHAPYKTVQKTLHRVGVDARPATRGIFWTEERVAEAVRRYQSGESQHEIGRALGVSQGAVAVRLRAAGCVSYRRPARRERHGAWGGGRVVTAEGYVLVLPTDDDLRFCRLNSSGYAVEHRLVMGRALGRPLTRSESVHHINGDKTDNRLENLQLRQGKHGAGVVLRCRACGSHDLEAVPIE